MSEQFPKKPKTIGRKTQNGAPVRGPPPKSIGPKRPNAVQVNSVQANSKSEQLLNEIRDRVNQRLQDTLTQADLGQWARSQWVACATDDEEAGGVSAAVRDVLLTLSGRQLTDDDLVSALARLDR